MKNDSKVSKYENQLPNFASVDAPSLRGIKFIPDTRGCTILGTIIPNHYYFHLFLSPLSLSLFPPSLSLFLFSPSPSLSFILSFSYTLSAYLCLYLDVYVFRKNDRLFGAKIIGDSPRQKLSRFSSWVRNWVQHFCSVAKISSGFEFATKWCQIFCERFQVGNKITRIKCQRKI